MNVSVFCPAMAIRRFNRKLRRADAEPCQVTITRDDGSEIKFEAPIPETDVDRTSLLGLRWRVRACVAKSADGNGLLFVCKLPPEDVILEYDDAEGEFAMFALPIDCETTFVDVDGSRWAGTVHFDECEADFEGFAENVAEPTTATGTLTKVTS